MLLRAFRGRVRVGLRKTLTRARLPTTHLATASPLPLRRPPFSASFASSSKPTPASRTPVMSNIKLPYVPVPSSNRFGEPASATPPEPLDRFSLWPTVLKLESAPSSESVRGLAPLPTPERVKFMDNLGARARAFSNGGYRIRSEHAGYFVGPRGTGKSFLLRRYAAAIVEHLPRFATIVLDAHNIDPEFRPLLRPVNAVRHALEKRGFDMKLIPDNARGDTVAALAKLLGFMAEQQVMVQVIVDEAEELWASDTDDAKEAIDQFAWLSGQNGDGITYLFTGSSLAMSDLIQGNSRNPYVAKPYPLVNRTRDFNSTKTRLLPYEWARFDSLATARRWYDELVKESAKSMRPLSDAELQEMVVRTGCLPREMVAFGTDETYAPPRIGNTLAESPLRKYCDEQQFAKLKNTLDLVHNLWMRTNYKLLFGEAIFADVSSHTNSEPTPPPPQPTLSSASLAEKWFACKPIGEEWGSADEHTAELRLLLDTGLLTGSPYPWKLWPGNINLLRNKTGFDAAWRNRSTKPIDTSIGSYTTTVEGHLEIGATGVVPHANPKLAGKRVSSSTS